MEHISDKNFRAEKSVVAFGSFDGLHRGHARVIKALEEAGREGQTLLVSLDTGGSPLEEDPKVLYTEEETASFLADRSVDTMLSLPLDGGLAGMAAADFIETIICGQLGASKIVVGENIRFGKGRQGDIALLERMAAEKGFELIRCPVVQHLGRDVSTDWIKQELLEGDLKIANHLLGRPYQIFGEVVHGKALGRTVGMPTANLQAPARKLMPQFGVYGTLSDIDGDAVMGLTNIGQRPSVDDHSYVTIETFLLDFSKDIYGKRIVLELRAYIRGVVKFPNLEAVKAQVDRDIEAIRNELQEAAAV